MTRVWVESNKLWRIAGPAILSLVSAYSTNIVIQAFGRHLGDVQLAAIFMANNVIFGFSFGLLVIIDTFPSTFACQESNRTGAMQR